MTIVHVKKQKGFFRALLGELTLEEAAKQIKASPAEIEIACQCNFCADYRTNIDEILSNAGDMFRQGVKWAREHPDNSLANTKK